MCAPAAIMPARSAPFAHGAGYDTSYHSNHVQCEACSILWEYSSGVVGHCRAIFEQFWGAA